MGKLTVLTDKSGLTAGAADAVWNDRTNTDLDSVLKACSQSHADRCRVIWGLARTYVAKAQASVKLLERTVAAGLKPSATAETITLAQKCFELFWGPVSATRCKEIGERLDYLRLAFLDDFTVRIITPQPTGSTTKASVRVAHKASSVGAGDHAKRIKFFALLVESGRFDDSGINSMWGTLVHEMSHLVLTTVDEVYSAKKSIALDDDKKIVNADNYKYYCELFQYRKLDVALTALSKSSPDLAHVSPEA